MTYTTLSISLNIFNQGESNLDPGFFQRRLSTGCRNNLIQKQESITSTMNSGQIRKASELNNSSFSSGAASPAAPGVGMVGFPQRQQTAGPRLKKPKLEHHSEDAFDSQPFLFCNSPPAAAKRRLSLLAFLNEHEIMGGKGNNQSTVGDEGFLDYNQQRASRDYNFMIDQPLLNMIGAPDIQMPMNNGNSNTTQQKNIQLKPPAAGPKNMLMTNKVAPTLPDKMFRPPFDDKGTQEDLVNYDSSAKSSTPEQLQQDSVAAASPSSSSEETSPGSVRFRSHQAENWTEKYEELLDYRLKNGHCLVPNAYPDKSLPEWVKRQRYQYKLKRLGKHSTMSDDRIVALEKIGFVWNSHDAAWEERLKELAAYKGIFGDCNVPSNYTQNPQLAVWVKRQRRQFKFLQQGEVSTMTPSRIEKLLALGFAWSGRKATSTSSKP